MQFKEKFVNQIWENSKKKLISGPILAHLAKIWPQKFYFWVSPLLAVK